MGNQESNQLFPIIPKEYSCEYQIICSNENFSINPDHNKI